MRWARRCLAVALVTIGTYLAASAVGGLVPGGTRSVAQADGGSHAIYLLRGPIHYDFLFELTPELQDRFNWLAVDVTHPAAAHLLVGWGGRDFYTTTGTYRDLSLRAVWRGVTGDASVLRVALAGARNETWPVLPIALSRAQYLALLDEIEATFAAKEALDVAGYSEFDAFYPAQGRFHIFRTCNVWIGKMLRNAGLRFGVWTPTPYAVKLSARRLSDG